MLDESRQSHLRRMLDQIRGDVSILDLPALVDTLERRGESLDYEDLAFIAQYPGRTRDGGFTPPFYLGRFVAELLAAREALTVLDPAAGEGWLAAQIASLGRATNVVAVTTNSTALWLAGRLRMDRLAVTGLDPAGETFDAIVSMPPVYGGRKERPATPDGADEVSDEPGLVRMLDVASSLSDDGLLLWIVPPRFAFDDSRKSVRRNLSRFGLHLSALIQIPPGAFAEVPSIAFELAVIERIPRDNLFVAALPETTEAQDELIVRLRERNDGPQPNLGRLVTEKTFFGLDCLEAAERANRLSQHRGLIPVVFSEVLVAINRPRRCEGGVERFPDDPDAVYLPEMARTDATTTQEQLPERLKSYLQLIVRRDRVEPEYLAGLLNTPLGLAVRDSARSGTTIPRISADRLMTATLYLPPYADQVLAVEALASIRQLRMELGELEEQVWERPRQVSSVRERISQVNHEDRFQDWVETLPFPLASVLRAYHAIDRTDRAKYERLLHFFEALAAFVATIHVSALRGDTNRWSEFRDALQPLFKMRKFEWTFPTFGMWRTIVENAGTLVRKELNSNNEGNASILDLYESKDSKPIEFLCSKAVAGILQRTNSLRNDWTGHGGAASEKDAAVRHEQILKELNSFRSQCGSIFLQYQLIEPREMTVAAGPIYRGPARRVMGSNPQFEHVDLEVVSTPITGQLHLHNPGHTRALRLVQLVKIRQSPQPACYFYNRLDPSGTRFVSYHFGEESTVTDADGDVGRLIDDLRFPSE